MRHHASPAFWHYYQSLPNHVRALADEAFARLKEDPRYPSLRFKKIGALWSARVGLHYRALATEIDDGFVWFWIGSHAEYDKLAK
ncbi:MAG: hypothetical protein ACREA0_18895 [bacterium]